MIPSNALRTVVVVTDVVERKEMLDRIYTNLTKEPSVNLIVKREANKVSIYHRVDIDILILIQQYTVVTMPVVLNTQVLDSFQGVVDYRLDCVIEKLEDTIKQLQSLQGYKDTKGVTGGTTLEQLARSLHSTDGKHRASKTVR